MMAVLPSVLYLLSDTPLEVLFKLEINFIVIVLLVYWVIHSISLVT